MQKRPQKDRLNELNAGVAATTNLTECLAVDFSTLITHVVPQQSTLLIQKIEQAKDLGIVKRMNLVASLLLKNTAEETMYSLRAHPSDTVRGWVCFMIGLLPNIPLAERFSLIAPLANDNHFGVREWAWLALRHHIINSLEEAICLLTPWTLEKSPYLRRFACEGTRPRGVWSAHITQLKNTPEMALPLLTPLQSDSSHYVQDSVGNWLNDAAKTQPQWVKNICSLWEEKSPTPETSRILKRALRSLKTTQQ